VSPPHSDHSHVQIFTRPFFLSFNFASSRSISWTEDPILRDYHFCNTFRVLDKGCQYLIKEVIEKGPQTPDEVVFRVILFDLFTKIETWELLKSSVGPLSWKTYNRDRYAKVLRRAKNDGITLYTRAFIKPAPKFSSPDNFMNHLYFLEHLMDNLFPSRLLGAKYMDDVYEYLIGFPSMGPFTAYQLMLGLSYTNVLNFHANDFAVAGPGSVSGANKLFGEANMKKGRALDPRFDEEVMRYMAENQEYHFKRLGLNFSGLGPQKLLMSIVDIEHMLCEVDKYSREAHKQLKGKRKNLDRRYKPSAMKGISDRPAVIPKAWSNRARREPRIRPERELCNDKRYQVDRIMDHCDEERGRFYLVRWVGYGPEDDSWEWESSLMDDAPVVVREYHQKLLQEAQ
jgi:hypothetical protein